MRTPKRSTVQRSKLSLVVGLLMLSGCSTLAEPIRSEASTQAIRDNIQPPEPTFAAVESSAVVDVPIDSVPGDVFLVRPAHEKGELADTEVAALSLSEQGLYDVLQMIFADTPYSLSFEGGSQAVAEYGAVSVSNLGGTLTEVMNKLSEIMGFFWSASPSGVVRIMPDQQFVVAMPPVLAEDNMAGLSNTVQYLGARDLYLDRINRTIVFRANRSALHSIEGYLENARQTSSLIVYDMNVLQVDLNASNDMGVRWELLQGGDALSTAPGGSSTLQGATLSRTSTGLDTLILGRNFSTNLLLDFLRTQGDVQTLSQPKLGLMNGSNGSIRVGQSTTFVSKVGSQIVNGVAQSQADTQQLRTGLQVSLTGEVYDSTIYSRINISITELLALTRFTALGVDLNLPEVADRELETQVRCRPGDTILLGGITVSRSEDDFRSGLGILSRSDSTKLTELVVTIRPKLMNFVQKRKPSPAGRSLSDK